MSVIPVYKAIQISPKVIPEKSGHTKPWVVTAETSTGLIPYVVKLYNYQQVENLHCVTNEIVGNILAKEFDLRVPTCALIEIPPDLVATLPFEMQDQFENSDDRLKFGTVQLQGVSSVIAGLNKQQLEKRFNLDTLYAFDNFICNRDRGSVKPNLLLSSEEAYLIDHELCFDKNKMYTDAEKTDLEQIYTKHHLCYSYLKRTVKKQTFFNEFTFYLRELRLAILNPYFQQLKIEGFDDYSDPIIHRIEHIKLKSTIFVNQLKTSLE